MHKIIVESHNGNEIEWKEEVYAGSKPAASRKANKIVRDCGYTGEVEKTKNQYDETIEYWKMR